MTARRSVPRLVALVTLLGAAAPAGAQYAFTPLALDDLLFDPFGFSAPALNDAAVAAFTAQLADGTRVVFRANGATLTPIATSADFRRFGDVSINLAGQVAFEGTGRLPSRHEGIFRGAGGPVTTIAATVPVGDFDFVNAGLSMNAAGLVAFVGERIVGGAFLDGVYAGSGGPVGAIYDETGPFDDFIGNPSLNDAGFAAFLAALDTGESGLFVGDGGAFTTVADNTGAFVSAFGFGDPSLNDVGDVAFQAGLNTADPTDDFGATEVGIFLWRGGALTPILVGDFAAIASLGDPSLNDLGDVAFVFEPDFGNQILVTGPDPVADRVIGTGDVLLGRTVSGILFDREGLNDAGQLAFTALFDDGTAGVFLATPTSAVPEPATWSLLATGLAALGAVGRRRRRNG